MKYPQIVSMPSAVSDWLEEQLEARGIDAVVYTRYILSLLHSDAVDVILAEEDQQFSHLKKEVRRSGGGYKHFRRCSSDWWKYAQAEAEQLKRSAAVECLLSASEQNFGIESLVDELCEKLKEISILQQRDTPPTTILATDVNKTSDLKIQKSAEISKLQKRVSPQELAKRYYAAFPPLNRNSSNSPTNLTSLIPKWIPSPNNKNNNSNNNNNNNGKPISNNNKTNIVPTKLTQKKYNRTTYEKCYNNTMKSFKNNFGRQRYSTTITTDYNYFNRNNNNKKDNKYKSGKGSSNKIEVMEEIRLGSPIIDIDFIEENDARLRCNEDDVDDKPWTNGYDDDQCMYDDLPVDIRELLDDSPPPQSQSSSNHDDDNVVEMMNIANMRDTGERDFIHWGTNISSSIWSTGSIDNNNFENSLDDFKFNSISFGGRNNCWNSNDNNQYGTPSVNNYWQWSENISNDKDDENPIASNLKLSLIKVNHCQQSSAFRPVPPRKASPGFVNVFQLNNFPNLNIPLKTVNNNNNNDNNNNDNNDGGDKDDLLTSEYTHFKPIKEPLDKYQHQKNHGQYADGATFIISNSLDKVNYKRSESGAMYLESDFGMRKKYCEYKTTTTTTTTNIGSNKSKSEFVLKYIVSQNDKACQTDETTNVLSDCDEEVERINNKNNMLSFICSAKTNKYNDDQAMNMDIPSDYVLGNDLWKYYYEDDTGTCDKCNENNHLNNWNTDDFHSKLNNETIKNIWSGGEVCLTCKRKNGCRPPAKLREDITEDGEKLLSHLSKLQNTYNEEQKYIYEQVNDGLSEMLIPKRRQSIENENNGLNSFWSFASRLEEDCIMQMSTIPTLRSVTL